MYQSNEIGFGEKLRRLRRSLIQLDGRRFELANALVVDDLLVGPLLVDVDLEVVALKNGQTVTCELNEECKILGSFNHTFNNLLTQITFDSVKFS